MTLNVINGPTLIRYRKNWNAFLEFPELARLVPKKRSRN